MNWMDEFVYHIFIETKSNNTYTEMYSFAHGMLSSESDIL